MSTPSLPRQVPIISISGSHREMGRQMGEARREQVQHSIQNARQLIQDTYEELHLTWESAQIQARKYIPYAQERYPQYVEEMHGIAEGGNVLLDEVVIVNAMEGVTMDALHLTKCTSLAVNQRHTTNRHVLAAHNEDWLPEDEPDVFLVHATPKDEPPFLAMTYGALLPNIGFNAAGICQCCDTVYPTDSRIGIPRVIVSRAVLGARTPSDAIRCTVIPHRAAGYNHLIVHESGELYNIEVSARQFAMMYGEDGRLVHTHHYLHPTMISIEDESDELISTRVRYFRALRLLRETDSHSVESLQSILSDHINYPDSICNHDMGAGNRMDREKTVTSLVMDMTERAMYATWGTPCQNSYHRYQLNA